MEKLLYIVIRVPKSGSQSLHKMVETAFPDAQVFNVPSTQNLDATLSTAAKMRRARSLSKRLVKTFGCTSLHAMWSKIEETSRNGDIVSGHLYYDSLEFRNIKPAYITLIRDPMQRVLSEYRYSRQGYTNKNWFSRLYQSPRRKVAGLYSFEGYLSFLYEHKDVYGDLMSRFVMGNHQSDPVEFLEANYFHYGILERMDIFAAGLSSKVGREISVAFRNRTELKLEIEVTNKERSLVEKIYAKDLDIYHRVKTNIC